MLSVAKFRKISSASLKDIAWQWRHNGRDGVSNHQTHDCLLNRLFGRRSKKTSKLRVTGLCAWNSPVTGEFPAQMASNAENVSIWWRHHVFGERKLIKNADNQRSIAKTCVILCVALRLLMAQHRWGLGHMQYWYYSDVIMSAMASQITGVLIVYSHVSPSADQRNHQSSASLPFVRGIRRWLVNSPHKEQ